MPRPRQVRPFQPLDPRDDHVGGALAMLELARRLHEPRGPDRQAAAPEQRQLGGGGAVQGQRQLRAVIGPGRPRRATDRPQRRSPMLLLGIDRKGRDQTGLAPRFLPPPPPHPQNAPPPPPP